MKDVSQIGLQPDVVRAAFVSSRSQAASQAANGTGKTLPPVAVSEQPASKGAVDRTQMDAAIADMNQYTQHTQRNLRFDTDEILGRTVVRVLDSQTDEVIRQIPDETFLKMARNLKESMESGRDQPLRLFDAQA